MTVGGIHRIVPGSTLKGANGCRETFGVVLDPAFKHAGTDGIRIGGVCTRDRSTRLIAVACGAVAFGQLALELRDQLAHRLAGHRLEARRLVDCLLPIALGLVDVDQVT